MNSQRGSLRDPILERIAAADQEEFERCVMAISELGTAAALGLTHFVALPEAVISTLAQHASEDVRSGVAAHPSCPPVILRRLASDPNSSVRRSVAANHSSPGDLLLALASDEDEWVRFEVGRNTQASDEAKAAFVLASTPEMVTRAREARPFAYPEEDPNLSESELRRMTEAALDDPHGMRARSNLADNPSLPEDLVPRLVKAAGHRWEWRSLWGRNRQGQLWPSTHAFLVADAPQWLLEVLGRYGHPAALLFPGIEVQPPSVEPWLALRDLMSSELLVRALWRELALAGAVSLVYWNDTVEGDQFFPRAEGLSLMEGHTPAAFLAGGYSQSREWIRTEDTLERWAVIRLASNLFGDDWLDNQVDEFNDESLALFALAGVAFAEDMNDAPIRWTQEGESAVDDQLWSFIEEFAEADDMDTKVTVIESSLPGIGYAATSDAQKAWLTEMLRQARSNVMVSTWGLSDHFLMCIALHPATPQSIRDQLLMDPSENVRQAARMSPASSRTFPRVPDE